MHPLSQLRLLTTVIIVGLVLSGVTAFPLVWELNILSSVFVGAEGTVSWDKADYPAHSLQYWLLFVREGLNFNARNFAFMAYGTDWLAFAHIIIALFYIPVFIDPARYIANVHVGIAACVGIIPLAMICGPIRGIPFYWQLIDCSFAVGAIIPFWWMLRLIRKLPNSENGA